MFQLLEFPSITLVIVLLLKTGRRTTLMLFYFLGGVSLTLTMFIPLNYFVYEWPILVLNLLGKCLTAWTNYLVFIPDTQVAFLLSTPWLFAMSTLPRSFPLWLEMLGWAQALSGPGLDQWWAEQWTASIRWTLMLCLDCTLHSGSEGVWRHSALGSVWRSCSFSWSVGHLPARDFKHSFAGHNYCKFDAFCFMLKNAIFTVSFRMEKTLDLGTVSGLHAGKGNPRKQLKYSYSIFSHHFPLQKE